MSEQDQAQAATTAQSLGSLFASVASRFADRPAVTFGSQQMTYAELNDAAEAVASGLRAQGVTAGSIVAIYLPRSVNIVVAMLGVIKASATYLPLDAGYPAARVLETISDAQPVLVITTEALAVGLRGGAAPCVLFDTLAGTAVSATSISASQPDDIAYIIYTSGSTGRPKGVMVTHHNVLRLLSETERWFHFDENDVWTMFHSFAFDFSVWEMWGSLLTGGRLVLVPFEVSRSPEDFFTLLSEQKVTVLNQTPSAFALLTQLATPVADLPLALRYVIFGGEALNLRALLPWIARHGDASPQLINMYGITETTVHVTYRRILAAEAERETESLIGEAIGDLQLHLLDEALQPVTDESIGEICIGGNGVALGYLGRPELTAERFIADPFAGGSARLYRSGDLARRRADGELVYLGRADQQVKINGFRIELGEVEAVIAAYADVAQACVIAVTAAGSTSRLIAYFVAKTPAADAKSVSRFLADRLPAHMRPALYIKVDAMPLTTNGKIDRKALPAPEATPTAPPVPPTGVTVEARMRAIWAQVLQNADVDVDDNFFDVGGTSVRLIAARAALQEQLNVAIPITWMFEHTTIRTLAAKLDTAPQTTVPKPLAVQDNARRQREAFARMRATRSMTS